MNLLKKINFPNDLKKLNPIELPEVCSQLREFIIDSISANGGHFASSLGVVELTVALHYIYNTPHDKIVWDVGHQAYGHKILTGRRDIFHTNRKYGGMSGFPKPSESEYDAFIAGHSSVSISATLGMAEASKIKKEKNRKHVAVIGDGAMTGGLAFEALNNGGFLETDFLVVLNDNEISIDKNVGALRNYLTNIRVSSRYNKFRNSVQKALNKASKIGVDVESLAKKIDQSVKNFVMKDNEFFESLNFRYFGPIDGHDVEKLVKVLAELRDIKGPKILHVLTKKGKGYKLAENNQTKFHATGGFDRANGKSLQCSSDVSKYQDVFGEVLLELAKKNKKIVGVTPAMLGGCSMNIMQKKYPNRVFDVGIAEQHAVSFSAGLASGGLVPFCNIYSTFAQRAYDQIIHDVCISGLPVVFCLDRGGLVGEDGETHHGVFDISFLRCVPNLVFASPLNEIELKNLMYTAQSGEHGPFAIRYPRGCGAGVNWKKEKFQKIKIGKGREVAEGEDVAILTIGHVGNFALEAREILKKDGATPAVFDMRFIKPLDKDLLKEVFAKFDKIVTVEDGVLAGGFGSLVLEFANECGYKGQIKRLGIPDKFIQHGLVSQLQKECGLDASGIVKTVLSLREKL